MPRLVILAGPAGVGKTTTRHPLAARLGFASLGPDDFPGRWNDIYWRLDRQDAVLECCMIPRAVRRRLHGQEIIVELVAPPEVQKARLVQQGHDKLTVAQRMAQAAGPLGYEDPVMPDLQIDTSGPIEAAIDRIAQLVDSRYALVG